MSALHYVENARRFKRDLQPQLARRIHEDAEMTAIGTPLSKTATRVMLLGSGELGKEVVIELQRLGVEVIAVDRYANAPAMQVAHRSHVINMLDGAALRAVIEKEKPDLVVPEIEAIATQTLVEMEREGLHVIPTARAARLTMDREGIRRLAAETLGVPTSRYQFADTLDAFGAAVETIGMPCVVKPVMSSSGKGQSVVRNSDGIEKSWNYAQAGGRVGGRRVIVEGFIDFDYEITLLTLRTVGGTSFCAPIGHRQVDGDYHGVVATAADERARRCVECERIARLVTNELGGLRHLRRRVLHSRRPGLVQRSLAAAARHRHGDDDQPGSVGVRAARARDSRPAGAAIEQRGPCGVGRDSGRRRIRSRRVRERRRRCSRCPACSCGCSANRKCAANGAWVLRWRSGATSPTRARKRARPRPESSRASNSRGRCLLGNPAAERYSSPAFST